MRWTVYVDMDAFYVSVELKDHPELRGSPVVVGPSPKAGPTRGVVLSASYEARAFGLHSAQPVSQADRLCPQAVWIPPDFSKYERAGRQVRELLENRLGAVVSHSIDEVAAIIEAPSAVEARALAKGVQEAVWQELQLPCSIGVAPSRIVAKIASDRAKPGGILVVAPEETVAFLAPLPVRAIPGVGAKTEEILRSAGIEKIADLTASSSAPLRRKLGSFVDDLVSLARGSPREGEHEGEGGPRSRSSERTFDEDVGDREVVSTALRGLSEDLAQALQRERLRFQTVVVSIRWQDFQRIQRGRTLLAAREGPNALLELAERLLRELWDTEKSGKARRARMISVRTERLQPATERQAHLEAFEGHD